MDFGTPRVTLFIFRSSQGVKGGDSVSDVCVLNRRCLTDGILNTYAFEADTC